MSDNARPSASKSGDSNNGDADSSSRLWQAIRRLFEWQENGTSLRAQIEDAIDEHEDEQTSRVTERSKGDLSPVELTMLRNLLHFSEHDADDVSIPRGEIIAISATDSWDELIDTFAAHGHSRLPVYHDTLDEVIGMMHIKDVFPYLAKGKRPAGKWTALMRQPLYVPQARNALDVLADMRTHRTHLAVVVDEYSGVDGIITIEDLVEEIVGEIEDEHDDAPEIMIAAVGEGVWDADARVELEDVAKLVDPRLAEVAESVDTLGGLAFVLAGQVPEVGAMLTHSSGWMIEITAGDDTHVTRLRLHAPNDQQETDED